MIDEGDTAPDFTAPLADGDVDEFTLSNHLHEAPLVLAFFPGAFTSVCTNEMVAFEEGIDEFEEEGATVYGVSVDSPFSLDEFRERNDLSFGLVSDSNRDIVDEYGVEMDFEDIGYDEVAKRSVFVVDEDQEVTYEWVTDDPSVEPDYQEVKNAAEEAT